MKNNKVFYIATHLRYGGMFNGDFIADRPTNEWTNPIAKVFWKSISIWLSYGQKYWLLCVVFMTHGIYTRLNELCQMYRSRERFRGETVCSRPTASRTTWVTVTAAVGPSTSSCKVLPLTTSSSTSRTMNQTSGSLSDDSEPTAPWLKKTQTPIICLNKLHR